MSIPAEISNSLKFRLDSSLGPVVVYDPKTNLMYPNAAFLVQIRNAGFSAPQCLEDLIGLLGSANSEAVSSGLKDLFLGSPLVRSKLEENPLGLDFLGLNAIVIDNQVMAEIQICKFTAARENTLTFSVLPALLKSLTPGLLTLWSYDCNTELAHIQPLSEYGATEYEGSLNDAVTNGLGSLSDEGLEKFYSQFDRVIKGDAPSAQLQLDLHSDQAETYSVIIAFSVLQQTNNKPVKLIGFTSINAQNMSLTQNLYSLLQKSKSEKQAFFKGTKVKPKAIIVEDNEINLYILNDMAAKSGLEIIASYQNPLHCLEASNVWKEADLLIVDQSMPEMLGTELIRLLRNRGFLKKVLMVSANPLSSGEIKACGADDMAKKPLTIQQFKHKLESLEILSKANY